MVASPESTNAGGITNNAAVARKVVRSTVRVRGPSPWRAPASRKPVAGPTLNQFRADNVRPRLSEFGGSDWPSATEPILQVISFADGNGAHRLVWYDDGSGRPPLEIVYLGIDDKGWSIEYEWALTSDGWVANTTHETAFEYNQPIAEVTTIYSGGGGGEGPGEEQQQSLSIMASKLAAALSTPLRSITPARSIASAAALQIAESCGPSAAYGFQDLALFGLSRTREARKSTSGFGYPTTAPAPTSHENYRAMFQCMGALFRGGVNHAQQQLTNIGTTLAFGAAGFVWQLSDAARSAGTLFQGSLTGGGGGGSGFTTDSCSQMIDPTTCYILGHQDSHPF